MCVHRGGGWRHPQRRKLDDVWDHEHRKQLGPKWSMVLKSGASNLKDGAMRGGRGPREEERTEEFKTNEEKDGSVRFI